MSPTRPAMSGSGGGPPGQLASASKPDSTDDPPPPPQAPPAKPDGTNADGKDDFVVIPAPEEEQQPGEPSTSADPGPALSSAAGTGQIALPKVKVGVSASTPGQQPQLDIKRGAFNPLLAACWWDYATGAWQTPATEPDARLVGLDWQNMLKLPAGWTPTNFVPTFYHDEPDPNQGDKPRLDVVVSFDHGPSERPSDMRRRARRLLHEASTYASTLGGDTQREEKDRLLQEAQRLLDERQRIQKDLAGAATRGTVLFA